MSITTGLIFQDKPDNCSGIQKVRFLGVPRSAGQGLCQVDFPLYC